MEAGAWILCWVITQGCVRRGEASKKQGQVQREPAWRSDSNCSSEGEETEENTCNHERNTSSPDVKRMDKSCSYIHLEPDRFSLSRFCCVCVLCEMSFLCGRISFTRCLKSILPVVLECGCILRWWDGMRSSHQRYNSVCLDLFHDSTFSLAALCKRMPSSELCAVSWMRESNGRRIIQSYIRMAEPYSNNEAKCTTSKELFLISF